MRQEQERFSSFDRGVDTSVSRRTPRGWNSIDTSGITPSTECREAFSLWEVRFGIHQEDNNGERGEEGSRKGSDRKPVGFEPFLTPEPQGENLFVNNYGGQFSQKMELNRRGVERSLKIAYLDGKVFLTNLQPSRIRVDEQGNELAAKRFFIFGETRQKAEEENPLRRVISVPEGWRIEINDTRITEELAEKKLSGKELQRTFINRFNGQLREGLNECIWREKCSSEKDPYFRNKLFWSGMHAASPLMGIIPLLITNPSLIAPFVLGFAPIAYGIANLLAGQTNRRLGNIEDIQKTINPSFKPSSFSPHRKIDHDLEYFMPHVEVDKVGRTFAYLATKGRTLVREAEEKG